MKKILVVLLTVSTMTTTCFAEETANTPPSLINTENNTKTTAVVEKTASNNPILITVDKIELQSELKKKFSAYTVTFNNNYENPLKINNIKVLNVANDGKKWAATSPTMFTGITPASLLCYALVPFTFGTSIIPGLLFSQTAIDKVKATGFEAIEYTKWDVLTVKNDVITTGQSIKFTTLVPLKEVPCVTGVFEDTKTHEYITVKN